MRKKKNHSTVSKEGAKSIEVRGSAVLAILKRDDIPSHLFSIPELDFSEDLSAERLAGPWFTLGARTIKPQRDRRDVEDVISRQSILLAPDRFVDIFDKLNSVGNAFGGLGQPRGWVRQEGKQKEYQYDPFHRFELPFTSVFAEPLVFFRFGPSGGQFIINPDLWMFFELEEKARGNSIWWDPRAGVEALRQRVTEEGNVEIVEIRVDYLLKYLQARQLSLLVGHYRHLHLYNPSENAIGNFVKGDIVLGSPEQDLKASVENWGLRQDITPEPFLQRRLHMWFQIRPQAIDVEDPWAEEPSFDPYTFTLPTRVGSVAPGRWRHFRPRVGRVFEGNVSNFMDRVYFRQEVLTKYEGASGFEVGDNGSVSCRHYWGLVRSTERLGNELLATAIGDFAEGVPFEEWPHWKQYAVEPPGHEIARVLRQEQTVPDSVNFLVHSLEALNTAFDRMATSFGLEIANPPWQGSLDSLAGRQLKWIYPSAADDDEFLKRATLVSTLVIDGLVSASLRKLLNAVEKKLHMKDGNVLASRNLLQRVTLVAVLIEELRPDITGIAILVKRAEGQANNASDPDLQAELARLHKRVRDEFAPLAFLYDLRTHGGLAHSPNKQEAAAIAVQLGLPEKNWHRTDYLRLLKLVAESLDKISKHLETAAEVMELGGFSEPE